MTPEEVLEIAEAPSTPIFTFGSDELDQWNRQHRDRHTGQCIKDSGYYVILHISLYPQYHPSFRVLSRWNWGHYAPQSWDVDDSLPGLTSHELTAGMRPQSGWLNTQQRV